MGRFHEILIENSLGYINADVTFNDFSSSVFTIQF